MNKNILIGSLIGVVVVVGGAYYFMTKGDRAANTAMKSDEQEGAAAMETTAEAGGFKGSFADMRARGGNWKCTVDSSTQQSVSSGVTYVSGGKMRADFTTSVQGYGNVESHVLADGQDVYSWSSMMPQGIKTKMTVEGGVGGGISGQAVDANQSYAYDCQKWDAEASLFAVPSGISFMTVGQ